MTIAADSSQILGDRSPIDMFTGSKQVFDVNTHGNRPIERQLMINVTVVRDSYFLFEIDLNCFVRGEHNPGKRLSKWEYNSIIIHTVSTGVKITFKVERIIRKSRCLVDWKTPTKVSQTM